MTERAAPTEQLQKDEAGGDGRDDKRQGDQGLYYGLSWPIATSEYPSYGDTRWNNQHGAEKGDTEGEERDVDESVHAGEILQEETESMNKFGYLNVLCRLL